MTEIEKLFFEIVQVSLGHRDILSRSLTDKEWNLLFVMAQKQAVAGITFVALDKLTSKSQKPPTGLLLEWIGVSEQIRSRNLQVNQKCKELEDYLASGGFKCCVLKGQGTALYYEKNSIYRQSGDIDVWVKGERDEFIEYAKKKGLKIGHVDIKHSDVDFFEDVPVEVHFMPSWMFCPFKNKKLQRFFAEQTDRQFSNKDIEAGFTHTTIEFDLVYSLVHIYRHVFEEGIGLRQLLDYYQILLHSNRQQRDDAFALLKELGMSKFVGGVNYVLRECFKLEEEFFICEPNDGHGSFLLSEILEAGNFGRYDNRYNRQDTTGRFSNGLITLKRDMRYLCYYPSEVLWMPLWKLWHWCWRKWKGYL